MESGGCAYFVLLLTIAFHITDVSGSDAEYSLIKTLFKRYDPNNRPVLNVSDAINVTMDLAVHQIIGLDETQELLKTKMWVRLIWVDEHLTWDPALYDEVTYIFVAPALIWKPDITLYQDVSGMHDIWGYRQNFPARITSDGQVHWNVPYVYSSSCSLNVRYFPFDEQRCPLKFGSWTYSIWNLDLVTTRDAAQLDHYNCNGEWMLTGVPVTRHVRGYTEGMGPFVDLTYTVILRRMPLYYLFNLVFPCLVITATAILVFCLPSESGEKVNLGVTVLLTLVVFLLLVAQSVPAQSMNIPLAGEYFAATIVLIALSTALTVISLNVHHRGQFGLDLPPILRTVFLDWLAYLVFMKKHVKRYRSERAIVEKNCSTLIANVNCVLTKVRQTYPAVSYNSQKSPPQTPDDGTASDRRQEHHLEAIVEILRDIRKGRLQKEWDQERCTEWALVSMVADRILFLFFLLLTVVVSLSILLQHPKYTELHWPPLHCQ